MNRDISLEQVRENMRKNLVYILEKNSLSYSALSELTGNTKQIFARWASEDYHKEPSFKIIYTTVLALKINIEEFMYCDMRDIDQNRDMRVLMPKTENDKLALGMFQAATPFDQDTVLRVLQGFTSNNSDTVVDFTENVTAEFVETPTATARTNGR